jgi:diaminohydroxyphosphoribosylaminopyrimidine deaminase/5-amino-6-(5-phosphoribosylamino)uracil reductase
MLWGPNWLDDFLQHLAARRLTSLMVEGGLKTLQLFLDAGLWDEARVLTAATHLPQGRPAPQLPVAPETITRLGSDQLQCYFNPRPRQALNFI